MSTLVASVSFNFVEFEENNRINVEHKFQVDETTNHKDSK